MPTWTLTDGVSTFTLSQVVEWDRNKLPIRREIDVQGRSWSRVLHDGAMALRIWMRGVILDTLPNQELAVNLLFEWQRDGTLLTLSAPGETYYNGQTKLMVSDYRAPRMISSLTHRWVELTLVQKEGV